MYLFRDSLSSMTVKILILSVFSKGKRVTNTSAKCIKDDDMRGFLSSLPSKIYISFSLSVPVGSIDIICT